MTAIGDCKSKSSLDFCKIDMNIIKIVFNFILDPLTYIFNLIICDSTIPDNMKISVITPLFKKGKLDDINNYRPISLLSQFSKILEKIIYNRFLHFIDKHNLLYAKQYGFIRNSSTSHALYIDSTIYDHYNFIESNLERNNKVASLFLDLKKAFDLVDHNILLNKLKYYGFRGISNRLIESYLKDRMLSTRIDNELSERNIITVGVPQGSILGPLLFILYINDIHMALHNLNINIIKAISINSTNICLVSSYTFLGIIIDNNLNFKEHIRKIQLKLSHVIYILRKLSYLPIYILKLLYNSLFLPHIMYCLEIWGNNFNNNLQCISTLQKKAIRIVNKNIFKIVNNIFILTNTNNLFLSSNILKFKDLIIYKNILFMHNVHLKKCPSRISLLFPTYNNIYKNTFHNFKLPYIKSSRHHNSLSFKGPKSWNNLCLNNLLFTTIYIKNFKKILKKHLLSKYEN